MSAISDITIRAPTRGNRKLEKLLAAVNADDQIKAWWHAAGNGAAPQIGSGIPCNAGQRPRAGA